MDRTIKPKFDKGRTQSVSMPPQQQKLALKKPYTPPKAPDGAATDSHPKTQVLGDLPPSLYLVTGSTSKNFPMDPNEYIISIGKDSKADITIDDNMLSAIHLMIVKINNECLFMDRGKRDLLKFDGVHTRQAYTPIDSRVVVRLGKHWFIYDATKLTADTVSISKDLGNVDGLSQSALPGKVFLSRRNKVFESSKNCCLIGAHSICDVRLHDEAVADFTAMVHWSLEGVFFDKMGACRAAVCINGKRIASATKLSDGDVITIGREEINVSFEGDVEARCQALFSHINPKPELSFTVLNGPEMDTVPLTMNTSYTIGRSSTADIRINEPSISRQHAKIMVREKFISVTDNDSYNKVKINMEEIEKASAFAGDVIEFGDVALLLHYTLTRF
jgi:pSer/pThr/pTyr-binding forkhead associated (FHA) protein